MDTKVCSPSYGTIFDSFDTGFALFFAGAGAGAGADAGAGAAPAARNVSQTIPHTEVQLSLAAAKKRSYIIPLSTEI